MNFSKGSKGFIIIILILGIGGGLGFYFWKRQARARHPKEHVRFHKNELKVDIEYSRPYKKGRKVFGGVIPYHKVWQTGADAATTFKTNRDLYVDGSLLKAGNYTLWTIPGKETWKIIFNTKQYIWGTNPMTGKTLHDADYDTLNLELPVSQTSDITEQFSIRFQKHDRLNDLFLKWDDIIIDIPFKAAE